MNKKVTKLGIVGLSALALASCSSTDADRSYANVDNGNVTLKVGGTDTTFKGASTEEKTKVLGLLEKYAVENNLTGISLFENGGYQMFNSNVQLGSDTYITGYGFGTLREGNITGDLAGESNQVWKRYYHTYKTEDPGNLNYMDDKGSVVGGLIGYASASYFDNKMNSSKDGYEWIGNLSKQDRPTAVNANADGTSDTFRFEVKVGSELKYNTLTSNGTLAKYAGREVTLDDYLTPYKLLWTKKVGFARAAENLTSSSGIAGANEYYNASGDGIDEESFKNVGVKAYAENGKSYLEFKLNQTTTPFMAMYYLNSSMYAPVPMEFIKDLGAGDAIAGAKVWGKKTDSGLTPVDTTLSTGAYVLEAWETDKQIVWKKNDMVDTGDDYKIKGIHVAILKALSTDPEAALNEFLANKLSACDIPTTQLSKYKNDPRTKTVEGDSVFKLNVNSCDEKMWEKLFGVNGTIAQTAKPDYWDVEPAMSNDSFLLGLSYAINRTEFADKRGKVASVNFFSNNYLSDAENGVSYDASEAHKAAIASRTADGTLSDGYSLTLAQQYFATAAKELTDSGVYKSGDKIDIEIAWMYQTQISSYGEDLKKYFEDAFNSSEANTKYGLKLNVTNTSVASWSDVYYKKMMVGQYDIAFGSISGNTFDPLNFMEVLKSDNSSGFTLNWGVDTNVPAIEYNGKMYSFDALWQAFDTHCYITDDGAKTSSADSVDAVLQKSSHNEDGTRDVEIKTAIAYENDEIDSYSIVGKIGSYSFTLNDIDKITFTVDGDVVKVTIPKEIEEKFDSLEITVTFSVSGNPVEKTVKVDILA